MNIPGMGNMMKQMQEMQENMKKAEEELGNMEVEGESGGGLVKVTLTGHNECKNIAIDDSLLSDDKDMLEDLVAAAFNDALHKVEAEKKDKMSSVTGGLNIPGGLDSFLK